MHLRSLVIGLLLALSVATPHAGPLNIADTPLPVSSSAQPNVMLLIDNSGSMANVIWPSDYDPDTTYPKWQYRNSGFGQSWITIDRDDDPITGLNRLRTSHIRTCNSGAGRAFRKNGASASICVALPDPLNGNTAYVRNHLNYLLETFPTAQAFNGALANGIIPGQDRMTVARQVSAQLVDNTPGMRFGVARFNGEDGARILASCGSSATNVATAINGIAPSGWTPLGEGLYEITRYFRGMSSYYRSGVSHSSPIQHRCQKNFTIVITDGLPSKDSSYPSNDPDDPGGRLPNWDGHAPLTTIHDHPNFPQYSDGFAPTTNASEEGHALFLDDIAKFAWDIDMRKSGNDLANESFNDPRFPKQNMRTYTVGFTVANQMLEDAAEYGHGRYFTANNASELGDVLQAALGDIRAKLGSSASVAANAGFVGDGSRIYQARFDSFDWSGQLVAFEIDADPTSATYGHLLTDGNGPDGALWDAGERIPTAANRSILTSIEDDDSPTGIGAPFRWETFSTDERAEYFDGSAAVVNHVRGSRLGDIVHSAPAFVGAPSARYPDGIASESYAAYKLAQKDRPAMIYVGANDGMLHGFDAQTGVERIAYVPKAVQGNLKRLTAPDYRDNHRFFVDGSPTVADAFVDGAWGTFLAGGLNKGGQSIYTLDVTDPADFAESNADAIVKWEFSDRNDADLGFTYSQPAIVKLRNNQWAVMFGNGYNNTAADGSASTTGTAALYIVDLATGGLIRKLDTHAGMAQDPTGQNRPNGLATVAPVDLDGDYRVDIVYAGDLFGNLWRFNLGDADSDHWSLDYRVFTACSAIPCSAINRQPITTRPSVIRHPGGNGQIVLFGTGKYLESIDKTDTARQSFYGIWDQGTTALAPSGRSQLLQQSILAQTNVSFTDPDGEEHRYSLRAVSAHKPSWSTHRGWVLDLAFPAAAANGERVVTHPIVRNGRLIFTTLIPGGDDPCRPGGDSWLMELDATGGSRLDFTAFDLNADSRFDSADYFIVTINGQQVMLAASGVLVDGGAAAAPGILAAQENLEFKYLSTAAGLRVVRENPGDSDTGRQGWRQLTP